MGGLAPLLASLVAVDMRSTVNRLRRTAIVYAIAVLLFLTAYGCGVAALALYLSGMMHPVAAFGAIALGSIVVALIIVGIVALKNKAEQRRRREAANGSRTLMVTAALSALPLMLKSKPLMAAAITGGVGLIVLRALGGSTTKLDD